MGKLDDYEDALEALQGLLVTTQAWTIETGVRTLIVLEGRDSAGKDGAIKRITEFMSPRQTRVVALPKPTERETTQWYFQRYVPHLPAGGETVIFNRSWYNRGGVEPVMGFCKPGQHAQFLKDAPRFEKMLAGDGIKLIKLWLDISKEEQAKRLQDRATDPLKRFKVSPLDAEAQKRWDSYSAARDQILEATHTDAAPWTVVATDDKKTARLN
ncbi:MAG: polyphosphate kinase 2, partial [Brevundimonas sp.]